MGTGGVRVRSTRELLPRDRGVLEDGKKKFKKEVSCDVTYWQTETRKLTRMAKEKNICYNYKEVQCVAGVPEVFKVVQGKRPFTQD